jgi:uncharacterized repeat protein (TIGR01451 family)
MNMTIVKRAIAAVAVALVGLAPIVASAASDWGPSRPTYTYNGAGTAGADHVVFNSFTNNPNYGDERTFFDGKSVADTAAGGYLDTINVAPNDEYLLRVYVHNNADPSLNGQNLDGSGVATGTTVKVALPTGTDRSLRANATIHADNAGPKDVFDSVDFQTTGAAGFGLSYVPGSAKIYTNATPAGRSVSDSIVAGGAPIGYSANDGRMPGCFQYTALVTLKVKVNQAQITFKKTVHMPGDTNRLAELTGLKVGDTVEWVLSYKNETDQPVNNVFIRDQLPAHLTVVPGSVKQYDSNYPNGFQRTDQGVFTGTGISIGNVGPNANGSLRFQTKVNEDLVCGDTPMTNNAWLRGDNLPEEGSFARITATKTGCGGATPPTTPPTLPQTGAEGAAAGALGTGALGYSVNAYLRSKRSLLSALLKR